MLRTLGDGSSVSITSNGRGDGDGIGGNVADKMTSVGNGGDTGYLSFCHFL